MIAKTIDKSNYFAFKVAYLRNMSDFLNEIKDFCDLRVWLSRHKKWRTALDMALNPDKGRHNLGDPKRLNVCPRPKHDERQYVWSLRN